jgi:glycosyltransferase involved in cell wall biosynthesis
MYAGKPTIVYAHPNTGVSRYAEQEGWAKVVGIRDTAALADAVKAIAWNSIEGINLVRIAREVAERNHSSAATVEFWRSSLVRAMRSISEE